MLAAVCMSDLAQTVGVSVATFYRLLKAQSIQPAQVRSMPFNQLYDLITTLRGISNKTTK